MGLDPAGPLFTLDDPANRLHHTDAYYVESIITDAGRLGFTHPIADANFYPNWVRVIYKTVRSNVILVIRSRVLPNLDVDQIYQDNVATISHLF